MSFEPDWPDAGRIRDVDVDREIFHELWRGDRRFLAAEDPTGESVRVGDLLLIRSTEPAGSVVLAVIVTHVWTHDGIAPGWVIASIRHVTIAADE